MEENSLLLLNTDSTKSWTHGFEMSPLYLDIHCCRKPIANETYRDGLSSQPVKVSWNEYKEYVITKIFAFEFRSFALYGKSLLVFDDKSFLLSLGIEQKHQTEINSTLCQIVNSSWTPNRYVLCAAGLGVVLLVVLLLTAWGVLVHAFVGQ